MRAREVMTQELVTLRLTCLRTRLSRSCRGHTSTARPSWTEPIEAVAALMLEHQVRRVPIVRDNKAVRIISASDIVRVSLSRQEEARS